MQIRNISPEDLVVWPDGTTCFHYELEEFGHKSDDYQVVPQGTALYDELVETT